MNRISKTVSIASAQLSKESTLEWAQQFDEIIFLESNKEDQAVQEKYGEIAHQDKDQNAFHLCNGLCI